MNKEEIEKWVDEYLKIIEPVIDELNKILHTQLKKVMDRKRKSER